MQKKTGLITTIGIPRALLYYRFYSVWKAFFDVLGVKIVLSAPSSREQLDAGIQSAHADTCLPVKLAYGHIEELAAQCHYMFLPRFIRPARDCYLCPKMLGFSAMIRQNMGIEQSRIIDPKIDANGQGIGLRLFRMAFRFTRNPIVAFRATKIALKEFSDLERDPDSRSLISGKIRIGVVGHPYNVQDPFINLDLLATLKEYDVTPLTEAEVPPRYRLGMFKEFPGDLFWSFGREICATADTMITEKLVDGLIYIIPFSCGLDSVLMHVVEDKSRSQGIPFLPLYVDEHTGKAAFVTRIEAFVDMLSMQKNETALEVINDSSLVI